MEIKGNGRQGGQAELGREGKEWKGRAGRGSNRILDDMR